MMASFAQQVFPKDPFPSEFQGAYCGDSFSENHFHGNRSWTARAEVIWSGASGWMSQELRRSAISAITAYQIHISPRKGFRCPHHQLHGVDSCSTHIRNLFSTQELPMSSVLAQTILRFQECNLASKILGQDSPRMKCYVIPCCFPL
jgi:putative component of membrane protein insertase Oxa1/YidC/SpoIIIJ protein YidD